jgi:arylamine N-acetyltransferase
MVIKSFTSDKVYQTTAQSCTCPHFQKRHPVDGCKHQLKMRRIEAGRPATVSAARAARIARNRATAASYFRMAYMTYGEF